MYENPLSQFWEIGFVIICCCIPLFGFMFGIFAARFAQVRGHRNWSIAALLTSIIPITGVFFALLAIFFSRQPRYSGPISKDVLLRRMRNANPKIRAEAAGSISYAASGDRNLTFQLMDMALEDRSPYARTEVSRHIHVDENEYAREYIREHYRKITQAHHNETNHGMKNAYLTWLSDQADLSVFDLLYSIVMNQRIDLKAEERRIAGDGLARLYLKNPKILNTQQKRLLDDLFSKTIYVDEIGYIVGSHLYEKEIAFDMDTREATYETVEMDDYEYEDDPKTFEFFIDRIQNPQKYKIRVPIYKRI